MPRGISRHLVRFVEVGGEVFPVKEATDRFVLREHTLLRSLAEHSVPVVEAYATVIHRASGAGEELGGLLITRHLPFCQPYRSLFTGRGLPGLRTRLLDALVGLFVRLHLAGFYWATVRCRTRCSAGTPARSRPTSSMPRPARCTRG